MLNFDRIEIRIINPLFKYLMDDEYFNMNQSYYYDIIEDLYINHHLDLESWIEFVLQEYPAMEYVGNTFDVKYTYKDFLFTKEGKKFDKVIENFKSGIEIDKQLFEENAVDFYSEIPEMYDELRWQLEDFFEDNKFGKKLLVRDKKIIKQAFEEGSVVFSKNGFGFSPNEYAQIVAIDKDGNSKDTVNQTYRELNKQNKYLLYTSTAEYKGRNVSYLVAIDIEEIAKNILKK